MRRPLCIDLFCGLGGWTEGFLAEGYDVIGFDVERHVYGSARYPAQLVLQDVRTIHGAQFRDASVIVASSPCQAYSYMAMPWSRAKQIAAALRGEGEFPEKYTGARTIAELNELFEQPRRIQREACEAAGRYIPMVQENVKGAQPWVGDAQWHYGSFYLWGDVPALMPLAYRGPSFPGMDWSKYGEPGYKAVAFNDPRHAAGVLNSGGSWFNIAHNTTSGTGQHPDGRKTTGHVNRRDGHSHTRHLTNQAEHDGVKVPGLANGRFPPGGLAQGYIDGTKNGGDWFGSGENCSAQRRASSKSSARKAASAKIAKIPFPLAQWIAHVYRDAQERAA